MAKAIVKDVYSRQDFLRVLEEIYPKADPDYLQQNYNNVVRVIPSQKLRELFQMLIPYKEQLVFGTNYSLDHASLTRWLKGGPLTPMIQKALRLFLITGVFVRSQNVLSVTEAYESRFDHPHQLLLLIDGDNLGHRLFPLLAVADNWSQVWAISCFRQDTIPSFINVLDQLYPQTYTWHTSVFSLTKSKDAADTDLSGLGMMLVAENVECLRKIVVVSNDGFSIELRAQLENLGFVECMETVSPSFEVFRENPRDLRALKKWANLTPAEYETATVWVIHLLKTYPWLKVKPEFEQLVAIVRESNDGYQLQQKLARLDPEIREDLEDQYLVLIGLRFFTPTALQDFYPELTQILYNYPKGAQVSAEDLARIENLNPGLLPFIYSSSTWAELLNYEALKYAFGIAQIGVDDSGRLSRLTLT